jgi:hypothetical protein
VYNLQQREGVASHAWSAFVAELPELSVTAFLASTSSSSISPRHFYVCNCTARLLAAMYTLVALARRPAHPPRQADRKHAGSTRRRKDVLQPAPAARVVSRSTLSATHSPTTAALAFSARARARTRCFRDERGRLGWAVRVGQGAGSWVQRKKSATGV